MFHQRQKKSKKYEKRYWGEGGQLHQSLAASWVAGNHSLSALTRLGHFTWHAPFFCVFLPHWIVFFAFLYCNLQLFLHFLLFLPFSGTPTTTTGKLHRESPGRSANHCYTNNETWTFCYTNLEKLESTRNCVV